MKNTIIFLVTLFIGFFATAQGFQNVVVESIDDACFGNQSQAADAEAELLMDQIMARMQLKRNFKIRKCSSIGNAYATIQPDENNNQAPYILYDPQWLKEMANASKTDWASIGVLAHEVGHLLSYHALNKKGSNPRWEVDADRFAGSTLAMMGSTLEEAQSMFQNYTQEEDSRTHPGRNKRLEAVKTGWMSVNNPVKKIILDQDTPEKDISPDLIINRYFEKLGGVKKVSQVKQLDFTEKITETVGESLNAKPREYSFQYKQSANTVSIIKPLPDVPYDEAYLIKSDSLFYKYTDEEKWHYGAPSIGTSQKTEPYQYKRDIRPSTSNFFDDFVLISNPEVSFYQGRKRINGEECFELQLPAEQSEIGNLNKKGKRITIEKLYYYLTETGMLYTIVEKEVVAHFKKGNLRNRETTKIERTFESYQSVDDILFPSKVKLVQVPLNEYDIPIKEEIRTQERVVTTVSFQGAEEL